MAEGRSVSDMDVDDVIAMFPKIDPFLIRKWHYAFYTFFDLIGNNVIEWKDFQSLIDAIGAVRGEGSEDHVAAKVSLTKVWKSMTDTMKKDVEDEVKSTSSWKLHVHSSKPCDNRKTEKVLF
ncbi:hypothetical protein GCK32_020279 [Trichostrongylus colubriformis]|uniref:EF-hand domain-containing protein n=1 Tax=Trichostrongylus colubriformis TaxID=6319 RepID=A0AAN8J1S1_TRICO